MRPFVTGALALSALVAACTTGTPVDVGSSHTRVLLTDSPFPYDDLSSVDIYVVKVEASTAADSGALSDPSTWTTIVEPHRAVNVLNLSNGVTELLGEADLSAAVYRAVRVTIDADSSDVMDASGVPFNVLWQGTGRQVLNALVVSPIDQPESGADIVLDFDLGQSFEFLADTTPAGPRSVLFFPVIRAVNVKATGTITGSVSSSDPVRNRTAVASRPFVNSDTYFQVATARVNSDGSFLLPWLTPGHYQITVEAEDTAGKPYVTDPALTDLVAGQTVAVPPLTLHPDTGAVIPDSSTTLPDSTTTPPDSSTTPPDSTTTPPDSGTTSPDSASTGTDSTTSGAPVRAMVRRLGLEPSGR